MEVAFDVAGVGNAIVDVLAHVDDEFLLLHNLVKDTMRLIDEEEAERVYAAMPPSVEMSGGAAANTVVGVASFGGRAAFIGKVRDDQLGHVFAHDIEAAGVAFGVPPATSGPSTARSLILITPDAARTMNTYLGASSGVSEADVAADVIGASKITFLEGFLWDSPAAVAAMARAVELAKDNGRQVAFTLSDPFCVERHRPAFLELLASVDVLFANEAELLALFEVDGIDAGLAALAHHDVAVAAVTRGARGSVVVSGGQRTDIDAEPVEVVDTTGAGDLYAAGVLFGLTNGYDPSTAGRLGALAAAEVISHVGARPEANLADLLARV